MATELKTGQTPLKNSKSIKYDNFMILSISRENEQTRKPHNNMSRCQKHEAKEKISFLL